MRALVRRINPITDEMPRCVRSPYQCACWSFYHAHKSTDQLESPDGQARHRGLRRAKCEAAWGHFQLSVRIGDENVGEDLSDAPRHRARLPVGR